MGLRVPTPKGVFVPYPQAGFTALPPLQAYSYSYEQVGYSFRYNTASKAQAPK